MDRKHRERLERNTILRETSESLAERARLLVKESQVLLRYTQGIRSAIGSELPKKSE